MSGRLARGRRAVFLDRDGVLNELVQREGAAVSPRVAGEFRLRPGAATFVRRLRSGGLLVFVVTNQPDVARGLLPRPELDAMTAVLVRSLAVDEVAVCPHDDADACPCRKPQPGLVPGLAGRWGVDLGASFLVGDSWRDVEAGRRAGCTTILLDGGQRGTTAPDHMVETLDEAAAVIERSLRTDAEGADGVRA